MNDAVLPIPVGDKDIAVGRDGRFGRFEIFFFGIKGAVRWPAENLQNPPVECRLDNFMAVVISDVKPLLAALVGQREAVRAREFSAPTADDVAVF